LIERKAEDFVIVECASCGRAFRPCGGDAVTGHDGLIHPAVLRFLDLRPG